MTAAATRAAALSPQRQQLLAKLLAQRAAATANGPVPVPRTADTYPLSSGQQRLLFAGLLDPESTAVNTSFGLRLVGALEPAALRRSVADLVGRHESLRTTFTEVDGEPRQVVHETFDVPVRELDLRGEDDPAAAARLVSAQESGRAFDLATGPLLRITLCRITEREHALLVVAHHIIMDGWSVALAIGELAAGYARRLGVAVAPPVPVPVQPVDYAVWERRELGGERFDGDLAYWRESLAGPRPVLELPPASLSSTSEGGRRGGKHTFRVPRAVLDRIPAEPGTTLFVTLLTAFKAVLLRHTGEHDLTIGTVLAGRHRGEIEPVIGNFVNMLALRTRLDPAEGFLAAQRRVRASALGGLAHQEVPFERVVHHLAEARDPHRHPLFQIALNLHNFAEERRDWPGLSESPWAHEIDDVLYDLALVATPHSSHVELTLQYRTDLIDPATVERLAGHLTALLGAVAADPSTPLADLDLMAPGERDELLALAAGPALPLPDGTVLDLVHATAAATPSAPALVGGEHRLTYAELRESADRLAEILRAHGVGRGDIVGVGLGRGAELVASLLAIWQTGAAYLPLDPAYPADRLAYMLADSGARLLVTEPAHHARFPTTTPTLLLDPTPDAVAPDAVAPVAAAPVATPRSSQLFKSWSYIGPTLEELRRSWGAGGAGAGDLAYLIYTSGSTGRPKGVMVEHRAFGNFIAAMRERLAAGPDDVWLAQTSLSFDISTLELFLPLVLGGTVVVAGDHAGRDGEELLALIRRERVTHVQATPSGWRLLLAAGFAEPRITALVGGEALPVPLAAELAARSHTLINVYGPTETTVWSTAAGVPAGAQRVGIGGPIANTWVYVLDEHLRTVPYGLAGELFIGGDGVARGYHDRPGLTADRFRPDPFRGGGHRIYATGDRVRWDATGELEFIGRVDNQIKLRGHRIELGEIEAALTAHPAVSVAAVVVRPDRAGEPALVAYTVDTGVNSGELRAFLGSSLPPHLIPAAFVALPRLPLTPNGKLDRAALPAPEFAAAEQRERVAPRSTAEELVATAWAEVLGVDDLGVGDDFFERGGHSLLAARVLARLRAATGVDLPMRDLFAHPTLEGLAAALTAARDEQTGAEADTWQPDPAAPPVLSFGQERLWFMDQFAPGTAAYTIAAGVRLRGPLDESALRAALTALVRRHEPLRSRFPVDADGMPTVVVEPDGELALATASVTHLPADERETAAQSLFTRTTATPFDLAAGPVARALLVALDTDDHVLLLAVHHIASDGWSTGILLDELNRLYAAAVAGEGSPLQPLPARYADYAAWQREKLTGPALAGQVEYWRERLDGVPPLDLATDRPRPAEQTFPGAMRHFVLDRDLTDRLHLLGRGQGATLYMTLLAGFQALLQRYTGQVDFAIGSPVAGRSRPEWEGLAGLFINMLTLRADLDGEPSFTELLRRCRETALAAYAHGDLPFEVLVKELQVTRDVSRSPLFQAVFALHNYGAGTRSAGSAATGAPQGAQETAVGSGHGSAGPLTVTPFGGGETSFIRYDLGLYFTERPGGIDGSLAYNTDLFDAATIDGMVEHLLVLLRAIVAEPDRPVLDLPLLDATAAAAMIEGHNTVAPVTPPVAALHHIIAAHVAATPDAPAVLDGDTVLTYAELDRRANQLAHHLRRHGVGRDTPVGICLPQHADVAVAMLGVLKAGGGYLPLDAEQPPGRLADMLHDAGAVLVLTESEVSAQVSDAGVPLLQLDTARSAIDAESTQDPGVEIHPQQLAYVIFTSGSTGRPKGVGVAHRQVLHYLAGVRERFAVVPGSAFGLIQSLAFDFGITVFYLSLLTGGSLRLLPKRSGGTELAELFAAHPIDYLKLTPSHLAALAGEVDDVAAILPRRLLILGGEASSLTWARALAQAGTCGVVNHYGPTETTVGVTTFRVDPDVTAPAVLTPIGRPLPHARVYILDEQLRPVPSGVVGEVYLGGDRLARGYLGRGGLTADRFLPDPFTADGSRMYRTGDQGRWLASGDVEFLGRRDQQVKVRGYRVELGEIETALLGCGGVSQAVVDARGPLGATRLVAYLVAEPGTAPRTSAELRLELGAGLPDYMIPSFFVWLDALPLKAHGKVDRGRLPEPDREVAEGEYVAPRTELETLIAAVFAEVLERERVGAYDDFFDSGGHSLLAIGVVARLRRRLPDGSRAVSVMDLFKWPTAAGLAALVGSGDTTPRQLLHELTPAGTGTAVSTVVCVPYGGGSAVVFQPLADALPAGHRLLSVAVPGHDIGLAEEHQPLGEVAARCVEEILERVAGPLVLYGHCGPGGALTVELAQRLERAGRVVDAVYLGGVFPFAVPDGKILGPLARLTRLERFRNDRVHANWLRVLGADLDGLDEQQVQFLVRTMRTDAQLAESYFTELLHSGAAPIQAPIISVVGERDPSTEFYAERFAEWGFLTTAPTAVVVLDEAGHYFLRYRAEELAEIVTGTHTALADGTAQPVERDDAASWWLRAVHQPTTEAEPPAVAPSMGRFLAVAIGQLISMTGSALTEFALPIWIYLQTGSLVQFAVFFAVGVVPGLLAAPIAGAVADRFDRRRVMLAADAAAGTVQLTLGVLFWTGAIQVGHVYVLLAVLSAVLPFQRVAYQAAVPQLVPKRYLGHANGISQALNGAGLLMVPLFAAGLLAGIGLGGILLIDVVSYAAAITLLAFVTFPKTLGSTRRETFRQEIVGGFRYSVGHRGMRAMVVFFVVFNLFFSPLSNLIAPLVLGFGTLAQVAQVSTAGAVGVVGGGLLMTIWGGPQRRRMTGMLVMTGLLGIACAVPGLYPSVAVVAAGTFAMTFCLTVVNGIYTTIVQVKVEQRYHARVFALNMMVAWSTLPIGIAVVGPFAVAWFDALMAPGGALAGSVGAVIGTGPGRGIALLYVAFALVIGLLAVVSLRVPVLARFDENVPDAIPDDAVGLDAVRQRLQTGGDHAR
ncbi:amino acid adenylation domain-containing protein [Allocatelliglobosispora scoriae]|uniref:Amino acid adenylation domain-containing protein n=1 Tax=Allocatelliglobosispora scoriae TaxID=643052 RepID=A0A841C3L7_9ACTN|nr:non-ribosomal peptide synthetase/MFS transporter [Allocatelliglobosispora scoriae]MBB5873909.1 amino acid adenylation domain-containing protein [Allocatelliglobosispora scoriae]